MRPLSVGSVLSQSFSIWLKNLVPFTILTVLVYSPVLIWSLGHKFFTLLIAVVVTLAVSVPLMMFVIPVTFFPAGTPEFLTIDVELPTGTSVERTFAEVVNVEEALQEFESLGFVETNLSLLAIETPGSMGSDPKRR